MSKRGMPLRQENGGTDPFTPGKMITRTPPTNLLVTEVESSCTKCDRPDNADNMVQCDKCHAWLHFGCAGVDASVTDREWMCENCEEKVKCQQCEQPDHVSNMVQCVACNLWLHYECADVNESNLNEFKCKTCVAKLTSKHENAKSKSSKSSSRKKREFELQKLEEERALRERIDNEEFELKKQMLERKRLREEEYLNKKLNLNLTLDSDDSDEFCKDDDDENEKAKHERIGQWVKTTQPNIDANALNNASTSQIKSSHQTTNAIKQNAQDQQQKQAESESLNKSQPIAGSVEVTTASSCDISVPKSVQPATHNNNTNVQMSTLNTAQRGYINSSYPPINNRPSTTEANKFQSNPWLANMRPSVRQQLSLSAPYTSVNSMIPPTVYQPPTNIRYSSSYLSRLPKHVQGQPMYSIAPSNYQPVFSNQYPTTSIRHASYPVQCIIPSTLTNEHNTVGQSGFQNQLHSQPQYGDPVTHQQIASRHMLAKIKMSFSGQPEEWPLFISQFERISEQCGLSNDEKLVKLNDALKGQAKERVQSLLIEPSNVPNIIATLRMLYGKPTHIIKSLLKKCRDQPGPKEGKLHTFIEFAVGVENLCCSMKAANLHAHLNNPDLVQELINKLPDSLKIDWARTPAAADPNVNLDSFNIWLSNMAHCISNVTTSIAETSTSFKQENKRKGYVNAHDTAEMEENSQSDSSKIDTKLCRICNSSCKSPSECSTFKKLEVQQRWTKVKENRLCFFCLKYHGGRRCRARGVCGVNGCTRKHNCLLHDQEFIKKQLESQSTETTVVSPKEIHVHDRSKSAVLFRIVPVILFGINKQVNTYAFLDEGSSLTLIEDDIAHEIGLNGTLEPLCLKWTADVQRAEEDSRKVSLQIASTTKPEKTYDIFDARTVKTLALPVQSINAAYMIKKYPHLKGIALESYSHVKPRILIGIDNGKLGLPRGFREGKDGEPIATKTKLGWVVHGTINNTTLFDPQHSVIHHHLHICSCNSKEDSNIQQLVKSFFSVESLGVNKPESTADSVQDRRARLILESSTKRIENRFETGLLWSSDHVSLPNSLPLAERRLECLARRLNKDEKLAQNLQNQIHEYVANGYIRKLNKTEIDTNGSRTWYLPIFPVVNPNKPNKIRMVWDAAATVQGISLNSVLLKGPDLLNSLLYILFRFRERKIAICGDIKHMFHQIKIQKCDQDAQRFIWRNIDDGNIEHFVMMVMTFGATCSPSSAQFVLNKNAEKFAETHPRAVLAIRENHYVDDFLDSVDDEDAAIRLAQDVRSIHQNGGFHIRNWMSNSSTVLDHLDQNSSLESKNLNMGLESKGEKILGMWWCTTTDTFSFSISDKPHIQQILNKKHPPTKRQVLRLVMSIFDPFGMLAHYIVYVKILLQEIWRSQIMWDDEITSHQNEKWNRWIKLLPEVEKIKIARCYYENSTSADCTVQLHIFVDASEDAYAAVGYLRFHQNGTVKCVLIGSKSRVAPLKLLSIPRLELEAALLGSRLAMSISKSHTIKISSRHFWSDNKSVLCWLRSDHRKYSKYVAFRISEILENSEIGEWRWVPTKSNVADDATKWEHGTHVNLDINSRWFVGPDFLYHHQTEWPIDVTRNESTIEELRNVNSFHNSDFNPDERTPTGNNLPAVPQLTVATIVLAKPLFNVNEFSIWRTLQKKMAYIVRAVQNMSCRKKQTDRTIGPLQQSELLKADEKLFMMAQNDEYSEEIIALNKGLPIKKSSKIYSNNPYLDKHSILRTQGRIDAANYATENVKRPILLPRNHCITRLIIRHYHHKYHHLNEETVTNELRQKFSIPKLRVVVRMESRTCPKCIIRRATPKPPLMGELPPARLAAFTRPFTYTGIDYFGPLLVTVGRRVEKRWGMLATCLTCRAVHIEIAHSLSSDSCILCLRNFMARRGTPKKIYSDNGTNFTGANRELQSVLHHPKVVQEFTNADTEWVFIPPASPHMGGSWERLVGSVKKVLLQILPSRNPSDELLKSMMAEVEWIINSRPLTYVPIADENHEALTPNHLLLGSSDGSKPIGQFDDEGVLLRRNYMIAQQYANSFWKRWVKEYLPTLTRRCKWFDNVKPIKIGDIVIIVDENEKRNNWPKARVIDVFPGKDNQVRHALVQTANGIYKRPAVKLAVLDIQHEKDGIPLCQNEIPGGSVAENEDENIRSN